MKRTLVLFLVCFLVCSSVSALGGFSQIVSKEKSSGQSVTIEPETQEEVSQEVQTQPSVSTSEQKASKISNSLEVVSAGLSNSSTLSRNELVALNDQLVCVQNDIDYLVADNEAKEAELKKYRGPHPYLNGGLSLGFNDKKPALGVVINGGVKTQSGFMIGAGAGYDVLTFRDKVDAAFSVDKLHFQVVAGKMW